MRVRINNKWIGKGCPVYIMAEAGVNHNGRLDIAKELVDAAANAGADAVKFQTFTAKNVVTGNASMASYQAQNTGEKKSQLEMLTEYELRENDFNKIKKYCDSKKITFLSTPHSDDVIGFLDKLVCAYKIGSGDLTNLPFLQMIARKKKPMILGTGMSNLHEVKEALETIHGEGNKEVVMLHCTTSYPCPLKEVNLKAMQTMQNELDCLVGYSDHTLGIDIAIAAAQMGAVLIEKHFTLNTRMAGPDHRASLNPEELKEMVSSIKNKKNFPIPIEALGDGIKIPSIHEIEIAKLTRKSIVADKNIAAGQLIERNMVIIKRPGVGLQPKELDKVIGKKAKISIKKDSLIEWGFLE